MIGSWPLAQVLSMSPPAASGVRALLTVVLVIGLPTALVLVSALIVRLREGSRGAHAGAGEGALTVDHLLDACIPWPTEDPDARPEPRGAGGVETTYLFGHGLHVADTFPVHENRVTYTGRHRLAEPAA